MAPSLEVVLEDHGLGWSFVDLDLHNCVVVAPPWGGLLVVCPSTFVDSASSQSKRFWRTLHYPSPQQNFAQFPRYFWALSPMSWITDNMFHIFELLTTFIISAAAEVIAFTCLFCGCKKRQQTVWGRACKRYSRLLNLWSCQALSYLLNNWKRHRTISTHLGNYKWVLLQREFDLLS